MQSLNFELEEFHVPETICHLLKSFNFVVWFLPVDRWKDGRNLSEALPRTDEA